MRYSRLSTLFVILGFGLAGSALAAPAIVLECARLIDATGKPVRDNAALIIQGDKITAVGTAGKLARPKGARVIDVHGRTIMPGLITAHSHAGLRAGTANRADAYTRENVQAALVQYEQY